MGSFYSTGARIHKEKVADTCVPCLCFRRSPIIARQETRGSFEFGIIKWHQVYCMLTPRRESITVKCTSRSRGCERSTIAQSVKLAQVNESSDFRQDGSFGASL